MNKIEFENLLKPLITIYDDIELDLIRNILDKLMNYSEVSGSLDWYLEQLENLGTFDKENLKVLKKNKNDIKKILENIIETSGNNIDNIDTLKNYYDGGLIDVNPLDIYKSIEINNIIKDALKDTNNIMNLIETKAIEGAKESYKNILNKAYIETSSGIYSYSESIRRGLKEMAKIGIRDVNYESGKTFSIESVVRREVLTRVNKLVGDVEIQHAKILGTNLVYVDQHLGARIRTKYTKEDYEVHAEWQGKKYMIDGSSNEYPNLYDATGYGKMLGLKGINCYHNMRPTWEWEKVPDIIDEIENKKVYETHEKQREFERKIRKLKREQLVAKETFDNDELTKVNKKLTITNKEFDSWLKSNALNRDYNREYVADNKMLFEDNPIIEDFKFLDNQVEHLIIYDINTDEKLLQVSNNSKSSVGSYKASKVLFKSNPNSLMAVHNHPSNSSFSFTDIQTFNKYKSINTIVVKTDKYLYYLEKNGISRIKMNGLKEIYDNLYLENVTKYGKNIETRHITNKIFAERVGWRYGRKKY